MDPSVATAPAPPKDPHLPTLCRVGNLIAPRTPQDISAAGLEDRTLIDLAVKLACTTARFTTDWMAGRLHLSMALTRAVLTELCVDELVEETMKITEGRSHYRITQQGRDHGARLLEVSRYVGPAPVSLEAYQAMLRWQFAHTPAVQPDQVAAALSNLVLTPEAMEMAGLAVSSGRSLFIYGPPGNGKSSVGRQIHAAIAGDFWIPHCLSVANTVIRMYDDQVHQRVDLTGEKTVGIDQRWVRIRRPMVVVGGELTLEFLDLVYSPTLRTYEAPPHLKANGGVFLVDDFGRERVSPEQLLNRFITPMEHQIDYLTLATGQKIQVPLRQVLIIATNLSLERVTDPAFLRRMGYRLLLSAPTPEQYAQIFRAYAERVGVAAGPEIIDRLLARYRAEDRELRACQPRDLIERSRDICRFHGKPLELTPEVLDVAWVGYFGSDLAGPSGNGESGSKGN
jgi:AAA domain (dynein-related subfamily)